MLVLSPFMKSKPHIFAWYICWRDGGDGGIGGEGVTSEPPGSDLPPEQEEEEDGEPWDNWDQSNLGTIQVKKDCITSSQYNICICKKIV